MPYRQWGRRQMFRILVSYPMRTQQPMHDSQELRTAVRQAMRTHGDSVDLNHLDVSRITDFSGLFEKSRFNGNISQWDVSSGEQFDHMFESSRFNGDISRWDTANATTVAYMFFNSSFQGNVSRWNTGRIKDMSCLFACTQFNGDVSQWDVSNVEWMDEMFSNTVFNGDISQWNTRRVQDMSGMFQDSMFSGDISHWNVASVVSMARMFDNGAFNGDIAKWNVGNVHDFEQMFQGSRFAQDISAWQANPRNTKRMFFGNQPGAAAQSKTPAWFIPVRIESDGDFDDPVWQQAMEGYRATHLALGLSPDHKIRDVTELHASLQETQGCFLPPHDAFLEDNA